MQFYGIFFGVETRAYCGQLCAGSRTRFKWSPNFVWPAADLNPRPLSLWKQSPRAQPRLPLQPLGIGWRRFKH